MGRDPDHPLSLGEVGKCGVNVTSLADMETLFDGISLGDITTSMTINSPAAMIFAMYLVVAEKQGADWKTLSGTIQNDILKEFIAQKEYIFPPRPSMRIITDIFAFCANEVPRWNTISVSGYHIREAGATALQELAFTLRDGIEYVQWGVDAGLDVDDFVPRMSFFFNAHSDFFEEIAKYRAARTIWADAMRDRFGAKSERSWKLRFHSQTAGVSLTAQQPYNNVVRTALQALSAVLGGTNSLHTNSLDEALALPTAEAATLALRTQQIIAHESGVAERRRSARRLLFRREADEGHGRRRARLFRARSTGWAAWSTAIERGFPQREIAESAYRFQQAVERKREDHRRRQRLRAGRRAADRDPLHRRVGVGDAAREARAAEADARQRRGGAARWTRLRAAARATENLMPPILDAVRAYATVGEMCDALRDVWGEYEEVPIMGPVMRKMRKLQSRHRETRARRPRPRRQGHRARAARRRHGGHLYRPAPDARADRVGRAAGGRRRHRPVDSVGRRTTTSRRA